MGIDHNPVEIFEKSGRCLAFAYGCGDSHALIQLGSSRHLASQEAIDRVKAAYGFTEEPKWYLSRDSPLWRAVKWLVEFSAIVLCRSLISCVSDTFYTLESVLISVREHLPYDKIVTKLQTQVKFESLCKMPSRHPIVNCVMCLP